MTAGLGHNGGPPLEFAPQAGPQAALLSCPIEDIFFGGAVGGGKSFAMLLDFLQHALAHGAAANGLFVRRIGINLESIIAVSQRIFPRFGGIYRQRSGWTFISGPAQGARLRFRHMWDRDAAVLQFQGDDFSWVCVEEVGQYPTPDAIDYLKTRLRSAAGVTPLFRATGNPGGAGHLWLKARYVSPAPLGYKILIDPRSGERRVFIPSRLEDNRILMESDPTYERRLQGLGSAAVVKALRFGDWDVVAGSFFGDVWNPARNIRPAFGLPASWTRRMSFDWGSAKPGSLGMWAIANGEQPAGIDFYVPRGTAVRFGEWYTVEIGPDGLAVPDVGLRMSNEALGAGIAERARHFNWDGNVADPSIFTAAGGPSIFDQMQVGAKKTSFTLAFSGADNSRVVGWQRMRAMMEATASENRESPGLIVFDTCTDFVRTVPVLQRGKSNPDDLDTTAEDHCFTADTEVTTAAGRMTMQEMLGGAGQIVGPDGQWHAYDNVRLTRRQAEVVEIAFSDGSKVRCTPDHRFMTAAGNWREAVDFLNEACYTVKLCTSPFTAPQFRNSKGSAIIDAASTISGKAFGFIASFMSGSKVKFRLASTFITSIMTRQTTSPIISTPWTKPTIMPTTARKPAGGAGAPSARPARPLPNGMVAKPEKLGILSIMRSAFGRCLLPGLMQLARFARRYFRRPKRRLKIHASVPAPAKPSTGQLPVSMTKFAAALFAKASSRPIDTRSRELARRPARASCAAYQLSVVSVTPAGRADVYCMTVPTCDSFALANGAIVHNCADEARYFVQSLSMSAGTSSKGGKLKIRGR